MGFRRLIGVLEPSYEISSRHHITDTVLPKHEFVKKHIHSLVQDISAFSFTTYIWTSSVSPVSLIRLIVQWIDEDFNPHRVILHGKQFRGSLTSHAIAGPFNESAYRSRQMQAGMAIQRCALQNGFFDKSYKRIFEHEALSDPLRLTRQNRIKQAKKNLGKAFIPCHGVKKPYPNVTLSITELYASDPYDGAKDVLKIGGMKAGTFDTYPPHSADPFIIRRSKLTNQEPIFRPAPGPKSTPVKSIITVNVNRERDESTDLLNTERPPIPPSYSMYATQTILTEDSIPVLLYLHLNTSKNGERDESTDLLNTERPPIPPSYSMYATQTILTEDSIPVLLYLHLNTSKNGTIFGNASLPTMLSGTLYKAMRDFRSASHPTVAGDVFRCVCGVFSDMELVWMNGLEQTMGGLSTRGHLNFTFNIRNDIEYKTQQRKKVELERENWKNAGDLAERPCTDELIPEQQPSSRGAVKGSNGEGKTCSRDNKARESQSRRANSSGECAFRAKVLGRQKESERMFFITSRPAAEANRYSAGQLTSPADSVRDRPDIASVSGASKLAAEPAAMARYLKYFTTVGDEQSTQLEDEELHVASEELSPATGQFPTTLTFRDSLKRLYSSERFQVCRIFQGFMYQMIEQCQ
ncbi:hypothetical protein F2P81_007526 [Scophthalmus maximus]|uniref:Cilia-and flagella-associated protein 96 n=1 Tax=Scophthalmus maximus TaxID=52904 RepID=A0A6A4T899_SCOMX|nr:hypothetical protein F2P81_007526 [Scophthalmus maximus]